jgi:hypothetical protein
MSSTDHTARPQLRLPGQAAAPEGPLDMTMMYLMHHGFRRDLARFAVAVPATPIEDRHAWHALAARWSTFSTALHRHHAEEDAWLWPALAERVGAAQQQTLADMEAEHAEIDPLLESCRAGLARMVDRPRSDTRAALSVRLVAAREHLARHLAHEETETIALMQQVLTADEWREVEEHFKEGTGVRLLLRLVPWVLHEVPDEVRAELLAQPGRRAQQVLWTLTRGRFTRQDATAFRHAPA